MKITQLENGLIAIDTPYNKEFIAKIKGVGAKWNPIQKVWEADARTIETVRDIMRDVYGQDDMPQEMVDIRIKVGEEDIWEQTGPVVIFGRTIATARGRDTGARVGDGVVLESGNVTSGGSMKNWRTIIKAGSVVTVYDVPKQAVEKGLGWADWYGTYEVMEKTDPKAALLAEKAALMERLAEIERLLAE